MKKSGYFWALAACLLLQALVKWGLAWDEPFGGEQFQQYLGAKQALLTGHFPSVGPAMATGPALPGGWYYFLLGQALRVSPDPMVLSRFTTVLFTLAATAFAGALWALYGPLAALCVTVLLSFHPVVLSMTSLFHNPNIAFSFLLLASACLLSKKISPFRAAVAGFCTVFAMQCNLPALIMAGLPGFWLLASLKKRPDYSFSWGGYAAGLAAGATGYLPYVLEQLSGRFTHVSQSVGYRQGLHFNLETQVLKPVFFWMVQGSLEVSSYFGSRLKGFLEFFQFQRPLDFLLCLITYASVLAALYLVFLLFKRLRSGFFDHPGDALFVYSLASLPFWFILAGRFDVKYTGLFLCLSYLPAAGAFQSFQSRLTGVSRQAALALALVMYALVGISLHARIYAQRGNDLEFPRYSYRTVEAMAGYLADRDVRQVEILYPQGPDQGMVLCKVVSGIAREVHGVTVEEMPGAKAKFSANIIPMNAAEQESGRWHTVPGPRGLYLYSNF